MCLTIPVEIKSIKNSKAKLGPGIKSKEANLTLVKNVKKGDWVLVQNGFVVRKVTKVHAKEVLKYLK